MPDLGFVPDVAPRPVNVDSETEPALLVLAAETDLSIGVAILGLAFDTAQNETHLHCLHDKKIVSHMPLYNAPIYVNVIIVKVLRNVMWHTR